MTTKEILKRIVATKALSEKYSINENDIDEVMRTAGTTGKPILQMLYIIVKTSEESSLTTSGTSNQVYKMLKKKLNLS